MQDWLEHAIEDIRNAASLDDLTKEIHTLRDRLSVAHLVYHSVNSTGEQYAALTYSDTWVTHYLDQDYTRIDPVVQGCFQRFHPVDWGHLDWSGKAARNFLAEARDAGLGNRGLSIPIRGPSGQFALFTLNHDTGDDAWSAFIGEHQHDLILLSHVINQKALEIEGSDIVASNTLSPRETDALRLLALGQSRSQAADHLAISEHTLRVYIEGARFKLGAMNTTHAVARALSLGLIVV